MLCIPTFHCGGRCAEAIALYQKAFDILKEGGAVMQPPHKPSFATCMSEVKDKFGFKWFLMVD